MRIKRLALCAVFLLPFIVASGGYFGGPRVVGTSGEVSVTWTPGTGLVVATDSTYAEIYVTDGVAAQSIAAGVTYVKSTGFTTNGQSANCTADATNDKITITKTGKYRVYGHFSFTGDSNSTFRGAAFLNGVEQDDVHWIRKIAANDAGSASGSGIISITSVPVDLDFRIRHDQVGAVSITPVYANLGVIRLGS